MRKTKLSTYIIAFICMVTAAFSVISSDAAADPLSESEVLRYYADFLASFPNVPDRNVSVVGALNIETITDYDNEDLSYFYLKYIDCDDIPDLLFFFGLDHDGVILSTELDDYVYIDNHACDYEFYYEPYSNCLFLDLDYGVYDYHDLENDPDLDPEDLTEPNIWMKLSNGKIEYHNTSYRSTNNIEYFSPLIINNPENRKEYLGDEGGHNIKYSNIKLSSISFVYNGKARKPTVSVELNDVPLIKGTDYTVSYKNNTNAGTASVVITGIGTYSGTITKTFKITKADVADAAVDPIASEVYNSKAHTPEPVITRDGRTLVKGTDYTAAYSNNIAAGTAAITITGKGNYTGTKKVSFKITKCTVAKATVNTIASEVYNGKAHKPEPVVKRDGRTLIKGTDYTVAYSNNVNTGTAAVTITGIGNCTGTKTVTFKITAASVAKAQASSVTDQKYTGKAIKPDPEIKRDGRTLVKGVDYSLKYENNTNIGTAKVIVSGKGNYTGTLTKTFKITAPYGTQLKHTESNGYYVVTKAGASGTAEVRFLKPLKDTAEAVIPSTIKVGGCVFNVTSVGKNAFRRSAVLKSVKISKSVTTIYTCAFYRCPNLSSVTLTAGLTTIGSGAFNGCTALTSIVIPSTVAQINKRAFYACKNLKNIQFNTSKLTDATIGEEIFVGIHPRAVIKVPASKVSEYKAILLTRGVKAGMKVTSK